MKSQTQYSDLKNAIENSPFSVLVTDENLNLLDFNTSAESQFRITKNHIGKSLQSISENVYRVIMNERFFLESHDSDFFLEEEEMILKFNPLSKSNKIYGYAIYLFKAQEKLAIRVLEERLRLSHIVGSSIVHEIVNPLTVMSFINSKALMTLKRDNINIDEINELLLRSQELTDRVFEIIKILKKVHQGEKPENMRRNSLKKIISESLMLTRSPLDSSNISVHFKEPHHEVDVNCCYVSLSQVFINLISNSVEALDKVENPWVKFELELKKEYVIVTYSDSGKGLPENLKQNHSEAFVTNKGQKGGMGLGLFLCKTLVENNNGQFEYEDQADHTQFKITLPLLPNINN